MNGPSIIGSHIFQDRTPILLTCMYPFLAYQFQEDM